MSTAFQKDNRSDEDKAASARSMRDSMPDFQMQPMQQMAFSNPGQMNSLAQAIQRAAGMDSELQVGPEYANVNPQLLEMLRQYQMGMYQ